MRIINIIFLFLLSFILTACNSLGNQNSNEMILRFNELEWDREEINKPVFDNEIRLEFKENNKVYIYLYFPDVSGIIGNMLFSNFDTFFIMAHYKTECPENFILDCKEYYHENFSWDTGILSRSLDDMKQGGYIRYIVDNEKNYDNLQDNATYVYQLNHFTIGFTSGSNYLLTNPEKQILITMYDLIIQEGAILFSNKNYSDSEIVSAFDKHS